MKLTKKDAIAILKQAIKDNKAEDLHFNEEGNPKQDWDFEIVSWLSAKHPSYQIRIFRDKDSLGQPKY
tara:strand:- start:221 stop:424 length:204 start_codon:yes stop_codon:yes gene_type:complete